MAKPTVSVHFDKGVANFLPGETVVGKCCINSTRMDATKGIEIQVIGEANVHFTTVSRYTVIVKYVRGDPYGQYGGSQWEEERTETRTRLDHHYANEKYLDYMVFNSAGPFGISGITEFPFKFELPLGLPCTYQSDIANIKYQFKVVIHRPSLQFAERHEIEFFVRSAYVLDSIPNTLNSATVNKDFMVGCCCFKSGPITLSLTINRTGYAPGEYIECQYEITNNSKSMVKECILSLQQKTTAEADGLITTSCNTVAAVSRPGIKAGRFDAWQGNILQIPLTCAPTNLGGFCKIIQAEHTLELKAKVSCAKNPAVELPFVIGMWPHSA